MCAVRYDTKQHRTLTCEVHFIIILNYFSQRIHETLQFFKCVIFYFFLLEWKIIFSFNSLAFQTLMADLKICQYSLS